MATVYLFTDEDGDYLFSQARDLEVGTVVMAVYKRFVDEDGGAASFLDKRAPFELIHSLQRVSAPPESVGEIFTFEREFESDSMFAIWQN